MFHDLGIISRVVCKFIAAFVLIQKLNSICNFILISSENGGGVIGHRDYSFLRGVKVGDFLAKCPLCHLTRRVRHNQKDAAATDERLEAKQNKYIL